MSMKTVSFRIESAEHCALLMHNPRLANPRDKIVRQISEISSKRKKSDEDHEAMSYLEFVGGLYFNETVGPYIPGDMVYAVLIAGAKKSKNGTKLAPAVFIHEDVIRLEYKGPREIEGLWNKPEEFVDVRKVRIGGKSTIMRTRPIFKKWSIVVTVFYDAEQVNEREIEKAMTDAGMLCGIGDYRPRYGRFTVSVVNGNGKK